MIKQKRIMLNSFIFTIIIFLNGLVAIFSPYEFVRGMMVLNIIVLSMIVGAFIREIFVLKGNAERNKEV